MAKPFHPPGFTPSFSSLALGLWGFGMGVATAASAATWQPYVAVDSQKISDVFSGHPLDYSMAQHGDSLYMAYYDAQQRMTVALYDLKNRKVTTANLPSNVGWDSHNYVEMALDNKGYLHVSGNMHVNPLVYFRSNAPFSLAGFTKYSMVGTKETSVTYPAFMNHPDGSLYFTYRDGGSGNGDQVINKWDAATAKWTRLADKIFDGQGQRNAYMDSRATLGPDGFFHVYWMWRESSDAGTTHDVSYVRTKDMKSWENAAGQAVSIPITLSTANVKVETIAEKSGLINRGGMGFDAFQRPIVSYHRFDSKGNTQMYNARYEKGGWKINQATEWTYRWDIGGTGTLNMDVRFTAANLGPNGIMTQWYHHVKEGDALWEIDTVTLKAVRKLGASAFPAALDKIKNAGMEIHWLPLRSKQDPGKVHALRWETMPANQDQPRDPVPSPTPLMLYTFSDPGGTTGILKSRAPRLRPMAHSFADMLGRRKPASADHTNPAARAYGKVDPEIR